MILLNYKFFNKYNSHLIKQYKQFHFIKLKILW